MTEEIDWTVLSGQAVVDSLVQLLDLAQLDDDGNGQSTFEGSTPRTNLQRVFGGQVAGQALVAAGRTVPSERAVHSLHSYFIRPGNPDQPIYYKVERVRDGGSFSVRRVVAEQRAGAIFVLSASFQILQDGLDHQPEMPEVPSPESLPTLQEHYTGFSHLTRLATGVPQPFDIRYVDPPPWVQRDLGPRGPGPFRLWMKTNGTLPADPLVHVCALTFASDLSLLDTVLTYHGYAARIDPIAMASLDHAMWFHRPFRADEWFLYATKAPTASGSRGLATGRFYSQDGRHLASVAQEGLIRLPQ